jgi:transcription initiation factor TFIIB
MWSRGHRSKRAEEVGVARRELKKASERLLLPHDVTDEATYIYTRSLKTGLAKGRPLIQIAASSLYAACREKNIPTTLDDVASASGVGRQALARWYRYLVAELDLKIPVADPAECLAEVASRAKADPKVEADALEILSKAAKAGITAGLHPTGLAASALYLASLLNGQWLTQNDAAEAAGVREATVRNLSKRLRKIVEVQLTRTTRKKRISLSDLGSGRSKGAEVPVQSLA